MTTLRKSESARVNGAKSLGPTTPEGELASSQNATQHGIFSRTMILGCESQNRFEQVLAELKDQVQPRNSTESGYVEVMAIARWRQMRVWAVQKTAIELEMARAESANRICPRSSFDHQRRPKSEFLDGLRESDDANHELLIEKGIFNVPS